MTYAVLWRTGRGPAHAGRLALLDDALLLEGTSRGVAGRSEVGYEEIVAVEIGRSAAERLGGRPVAVIRSAVGETIEVAMLGGAGLLPELVEQLDSARSNPMSR
jgi:hypothetical protein